MIFAPIFTWLVDQFGSIWAKVIEVVFVVLLIAAPFVITYYDGKRTCENADALNAAQARVETVTALSKLGAAAELPVGEYELRIGASETVIQTIIKEVTSVTTIYKPSPTAPAQALPMCVFTGGFVRLWNSALKAGNDAAGLPKPGAAAAGTPSAASSAATADDADLYDSGIHQADVLNNHIANADACNAAIAWHDAVIARDKALFGDRH